MHLLTVNPTPMCTSDRKRTLCFSTVLHISCKVLLQHAFTDGTKQIRCKKYAHSIHTHSLTRSLARSRTNTMHCTEISRTGYHAVHYPIPQAVMFSVDLCNFLNSSVTRSRLTWVRLSEFTVSRCDRCVCKQDTRYTTKLSKSASIYAD